MSAPGTPALSAHVKAIKGHALSADKKELSVLLEAKHVGELSIVLSTDQFEQLAAIVDQVRSELSSNGAEGSKGVERSQGSEKNELKVVVPKDWAVAADLKVHDLVLLIFNRQSAARTAYALDPVAAKGMAEGLVKNADVVLKKKQGRATNEPRGGKH
jgi:hypothetical protein